MITSIEDFTNLWKLESGSTQKLLNVLTDDSLAQPVADDHRTLGRIAWHIVVTIPEMMGKTGLDIVEPAEDAPLPATAAEIAAEYERVSQALVDQIVEKFLLSCNLRYNL